MQRPQKAAKKTVPHPLPPINKLQSPHEIKSQPINQAALTIRNGSKTTPCFNLRRADGNFHLWWSKMSVKNVLKNFQMSEQYWGCLGKMSEVNFSPAETLEISSTDILLPSAESFKKGCCQLQEKVCA